MSDHVISIVPKLSRFPNKEKKVKEILDWLISENIIKPEPSDCTLGASDGYPFSDGAKNVVLESKYLPYKLKTNGLGVSLNRVVFNSNDIEEFFCPACNKNIAAENWNFFNPWANGETDNLICPKCGNDSEIHTYEIKPDWGFSDFGFQFWNWPALTQEFINEFERRLGCEVAVVYWHL